MGIAVAPSGPKAHSSFVEEFLAIYRKSRQDTSVRQMERHARNFFAYAESRGVTTIQGVTKAICRDYLESRFKAGTAHDTLRTERGYLVGIWSRAIDDGLMTVNPWAKLKPPGKPAAADYTFWTADEIEAIATNCLKPWQSALVRVLGTTGLRVSTGLAMRWDWVNWSAGVIRIPRGKNIKTQYEHVLSEKARSLLEQRQILDRTSPLVFPHPVNGGAISYATAETSIARAIVKAGVKPGTVHDLRHSYARGFVAAGGPLPMLQRQLGHSAITMTMKYASADQESVRATLAKMDAQQVIPPSPSPPQDTP